MSDSGSDNPRDEAWREYMARYGRATTDVSPDTGADFCAGFDAGMAVVERRVADAENAGSDWATATMRSLRESINILEAKIEAAVELASHVDEHVTGPEVALAVLGALASGQEGSNE